VVVSLGVSVWGVIVQDSHPAVGLVVSLGVSVWGVIVQDSHPAVGLSSNALDSINVVTLRRARLVPGWVTVFRQVNHPGTEPGTQIDSA